MSGEDQTCQVKPSYCFQLPPMRGGGEPSRRGPQWSNLQDSKQTVNLRCPLLLCHSSCTWNIWIFLSEVAVERLGPVHSMNFGFLFLTKAKKFTVDDHHLFTSSSLHHHLWLKNQNWVSHLQHLSRSHHPCPFLSPCLCSDLIWMIPDDWKLESEIYF